MLQALETGGWLDDAGGRMVEFDEPSESLNLIQGWLDGATVVV